MRTTPEPARTTNAGKMRIKRCMSEIDNFAIDVLTRMLSPQPENSTTINGEKRKDVWKRNQPKNCRGK